MTAPQRPPAVDVGAAASRRAAPVDLVVVGAGIVGLAHAVAALDRGMSVHILDRNDRPVGASVQNFGHGCFTAQDGLALRYATAARKVWRRLARDAGLWIRETGTLVVARATDELAVLHEFAEARDGEVKLLDADDVLGHAPVARDGLLGGALLPGDLRVDPRTAVPQLARWIAERPGVRISWSTPVHTVESGAVYTPAGVVRAGSIVVAVGHDIDRHFPQAASAHQVTRCKLHMLRVDAPGGHQLTPALLTGSSLLRYGGFASQPSAHLVRRRLAAQQPALLDADVNLMCTQLPDGTLILGDTHTYAHTHDVYRDEAYDELLLTEGARLFGVERLRVRQRWTGTYASSTLGPYLDVIISPGVHAVSVTSGIGMTTAFGLAQDVIGRLSPSGAFEHPALC
jgi:D-hydroxyproline dehydrogenase subunit beta